MATAAELRQRVYDRLFGAFPTEAPFVTRLGASYTSGATSITVLDATQWELNDVLENTETGEQFKVVAKPGGNVLTVVPGWAGTTNAASVGTDDVLYRNPRFTRKQIDDAVTSVLGELETWGVHVFGYGSITRADPKTYYEISETDVVDYYGVLKLYRVSENSERPAVLPFLYHYDLSTTPAEWSTGRGIKILNFGGSNDADVLYYTYAKRIDAATDLLDRQLDLVVSGVVGKLLVGTVVPATHDPGARTDRTVQPGQTGRDARVFQAQFFTLVRTEAAQLSVERQRLVGETPYAGRARRWRG